MADCPLDKCLNEGDAAIDVRILDSTRNDAVMIIGIDYYKFLDNMRKDENENV